jgi:catechol 2,3-dioxygenase-like lactoylglutathione lyase family enzyme
VACTEVFERGGLRSVYLRDPDGHIVELATAA